MEAEVKSETDISVDESWEADFKSADEAVDDFPSLLLKAEVKSETDISVDESWEADLKSADEAVDDFPSLLLKADENDDFVFETSSYALQNNKDYQELLKCLVKLESQRVYTVKALEEVQQARVEALRDPFAFVEALQNGDLHFRPRLKIAHVPAIDMATYDISSYIEAIRPNTRRSSREVNTMSSLLDQKNEPEFLPTNDKPSKPRSVTHNIYWTTDEQRRLEELLIKYPDEPIAAKRYAKIAKELGTRTLMQVQSRVQKYFIALKKEGLPVPGRDPKTAGLRTVARKRSYFPQTCSSAKFMKAFDFEDPTTRRKRVNNGKPLAEMKNDCFESDVYDENKIKIEGSEVTKDKNILALQNLRQLKLQELKTGDIAHVGIKCAGCLCEPIRGIRWHCDICPLNLGVDLCDRCSDHFITAKHTKKHSLRPITSVNIKDYYRYLASNS